MALPRLQQTLLSEILNELPEETAQLQDAALAIATKYRADLHTQLEQTQRFQEHVTRTHEKVHRRLKHTARAIEENSRRAKVDGSQPGRVLCDEVETLSQDVMGKLMGVVELLGDTGANIDGDKYPLLKKVLGQEGFEVVEIPSDAPSVGGISESEVEHEEADTTTDPGDSLEEGADQIDGSAEMDNITLNGASQELQSMSIAPSHSIESSDHDEEPSTEDQSDSHVEEELSHDDDVIETEDESGATDDDAMESATVNAEITETNTGDTETPRELLSPIENDPTVISSQPLTLATPMEITVAVTNASIIETDTTDPTDPLAAPSITQQDDPSTPRTPPDSQAHDELTSLESTIDKYKAKKIKSFPMPTVPTISSPASSVITASTTSVQGVTYAPSVRSSTSLNESLKKFI